MELIHARCVYLFFLVTKKEEIHDVHSTLQGDGGGPLVCERNDGSYAVAGLVAWGIDCGQPGVPGVYVNVQQFLGFINDHTVKYFEPQGWGRTPPPRIFQSTTQQPRLLTGLQQSVLNPYQQRSNPNEYRHTANPEALQTVKRPLIDSASQVRPPQSFPASGY